MLEVALFAILASGLWVVTRQFTHRKYPVLLLDETDDRRALSKIAEGGLYQITAPFDTDNLREFRSLQLIEGGLRLQDNGTKAQHIIDFATIQWVSAVTTGQEGIATLSMHLEINRHWRIVSLQMPEADMIVLVNVLRQAINDSRLNIGRPPSNPIGPLPAYIAEDTLQGVSNIGAEVSLYLLPHMLIVLQGDVVQAKLDTSSVRRVLAVERVSNRIDQILKPSTPDGVIRLYSLYETVAFALPQYRELADEISYLSRCPVEFITQDDKSGKV